MQENWVRKTLQRVRRDYKGAMHGSFREPRERDGPGMDSLDSPEKHLSYHQASVERIFFEQRLRIRRL